MKIFKMTFSWIAACMMTVIVSAVSMTACSSSEDLKSSDEDDNQSAEYAELINALNDYSIQFSETHSSLSRGDLGWSKFKESVKADHVGYNGGSWVGSIGESRKKWKELKKAEQEEKVETYALTNQERTIITNQVDSLKSVYLADDTNIGAIHNAVILQSILNDDMYFETTEQLVRSIIASVNALGIELHELDVQDVVHEIDEFFETIYDDDISVMYDRLSKKYPEREEEFKILNQYLSTTENIGSVEDIMEFSEGYVSIINQSNISPAVKKALSSNISIAPSSHKLWRMVETLSK